MNAMLDQRFSSIPTTRHGETELCQFCTDEQPTTALVTFAVSRRNRKGRTKESIRITNHLMCQDCALETDELCTDIDWIELPENGSLRNIEWWATDHCSFCDAKMGDRIRGKYEFGMDAPLGDDVQQHAALCRDCAKIIERFLWSLSDLDESAE